MESPSSLFVSILILVAILNITASQSVLMPPRFQSSREDIPAADLVQHDGDVMSETMPHQLTINEGEEIDVKVDSKSHITMNLNRAIPVDVNVSIIIFSGPNLISFGRNLTTYFNVADNYTSVIVTYKANTFGDRPIEFTSNKLAGHAEIVCKVVNQPKDSTIDDSSAYISVNVGKSYILNLSTSIVGWLYFFAWSLSFYFQVILNFQRKSVVGLNFDFLALNLLGFTCYSIFNFTLMFSREAQKEYYTRNMYSRIPVEYCDLIFATHAFVLTLITVIQCFIYERGDQKISIPAKGFVIVTTLVAIGLAITLLFQRVAILDVVLYLSYVKLAITLIKYTPQAYMNYKRQATTGWSIHNILLDFTGGSLSIAQMFLIAYNYDDWISIFGNFTKFGLGVISIAFDMIFVVQHYILYKQNAQAIQSDDDIPSPVISQTVMSNSFRQAADEESNQ